VVKDMPATEGLAFSPDDKFLCVNGSRDNYVNRYEVRADGTLASAPSARRKCPPMWDSATR
jgi:sugar lactone lactonase YvrE